MESGRKLKQRLARMFRFACKPSAVLDRRRRDALDPVFVDCGGSRLTAPLPAAEQGERRRSLWREGRTCTPPASSPSYPSRNSSSSSYHRSRRSGRAIEKRNTTRLRSDAYGFTSSSSGETDDRDDENDGLFFTSEEKEESTTVFSSGSSEFYASAKKSKKLSARRCATSQRREAAAHWPAGGCRGCGFRPVVAVIDGDDKKKKHKIEEKQSRDPYKDFRRSMAEMIVEGQMFRAPDLESLLQSYLALNPSHLHPLILQAFSDIWVLLFHH